MMAARHRKQSADYINSKVGISDHALLRYIERVHHLDLKDVRSKLLAKGLQTAIDMNARSITIEGVRFVIVNKTVVTAYLV